MIGCLHIPDFAAWAHRRHGRDASFLAVYHRGRIIAQTRSLRRAGLQIGDALERAQSLFPDAVLIRHDPVFESSTWSGVVQRVYEYSPFLEPVTEGLVFFKPYNFEEACELVASLSAQAGLGPSRSTAHIAAVRAAPSSVLQIKQQLADRFLSKTPVDILPSLGFDDYIPPRLQLFGLKTLGSLLGLTQQHLRGQFGKEGARLHTLLHPDHKPPLPLYRPPAQLTEKLSLDYDCSDAVQLKAVITHLVDRLAYRLGRRRCTQLSLKMHVRSTAPPPFVQRILREPTSKREAILFAALSLLDTALAGIESVYQMQLSLGGLSNPDFLQGKLFFERPPLRYVLDNVENRFPGAVRRAVVGNPEAPFPEDSVELLPHRKGQ